MIFFWVLAPRRLVGKYWLMGRRKEILLENSDRKSAYSSCCTAKSARGDSTTKESEAWPPLGGNFSRVVLVC